MSWPNDALAVHEGGMEQRGIAVVLCRAKLVVK
jgi:hypothetical protein